MLLIYSIVIPPNKYIGISSWKIDGCFMFSICLKCLILTFVILLAIWLPFFFLISNLSFFYSYIAQVEFLNKKTICEIFFLSQDTFYETLCFIDSPLRHSIQKNIYLSLRVTLSYVCRTFLSNSLIIRAKVNDAM